MGPPHAPVGELRAIDGKALCAAQALPRGCKRNAPSGPTLPVACRGAVRCSASPKLRHRIRRTQSRVVACLQASTVLRPKNRATPPQMRVYSIPRNHHPPLSQLRSGEGWRTVVVQWHVHVANLSILVHLRTQGLDGGAFVHVAHNNAHALAPMGRGPVTPAGTAARRRATPRTAASAAPRAAASAAPRAPAPASAPAPAAGAGAGARAASGTLVLRLLFVGH
jgi:hypothetical protein